MARPTKEGLEYFPTDVDIFDDPKLLFVTNKFGDYGDLIAVKLLTWIYRNGYYLEWNEEMLLLFTARAFKSVEIELVKNVVEELIRRDFFSRQIFESHGVLTSRGIQRRWLHIQKSMKRKANINNNLSLVESEETSSKEEETPPTEEETPDETEFSTQKESKRKEIKEKKRKEIETHFFYQETQMLFKGKTKIQNPNLQKHIEPVISFFHHIPKPLTKSDIEKCIREEFVKFDTLTEQSGEPPGVNMEYLTKNIQAKITALSEEKLEKLKEPEKKQAEIDRENEKKREHEEKMKFWKQKGKEYMDYFNENSKRFSAKEKNEFLKLFEEKRYIEAGAIIEAKMEEEELC